MLPFWKETPTLVVQYNPMPHILAVDIIIYILYILVFRI